MQASLNLRTTSTLNCISYLFCQFVIVSNLLRPGKILKICIAPSADLAIPLLYDFIPHSARTVLQTTTKKQRRSLPHIPSFSPRRYLWQPFVQRNPGSIYYLFVPQGPFDFIRSLISRTQAPWYNVRTDRTHGNKNKWIMHPGNCAFGRIDSSGFGGFPGDVGLWVYCFGSLHFSARRCVGIYGIPNAWNAFDPEIKPIRNVPVFLYATASFSIHKTPLTDRCRSRSFFRGDLQFQETDRE